MPWTHDREPLHAALALNRLDQDLASNGRIESRVLGSSLAILASATARQTVLLDRRRQPASLDNPTSGSETSVVLEEHVDLTSTLSTFVDGPDDERLSASCVSASPDSVDTAGIGL